MLGFCQITLQPIPPNSENLSEEAPKGGIFGGTPFGYPAWLPSPLTNVSIYSLFKNCFQRKPQSISESITRR